MPLGTARGFFLNLAWMRGHKAQVAENRQGNHQPPAVPDQRRPRLPVARPLGGNPVRRRGAAHPAGLADRLRPHRRHVRARRAVDRPAPARQRPPAGTLKQLRDIGNTVIVVEHDEDAIRCRRLRGRHRPRRRRAWRPHRRVVAQGTPAEVEPARFDDRRLPCPASAGSPCRPRRRSPTGRKLLHVSAPPATT